MKKVLRNVFIYGSKIIRITFTSAVICFSMTFALMLLNGIMGISIRLGYYSTIAILSSVVLTIGLVLFNSKRIFAKKKISPSKAKSRNKANTKRRQTNQSKRKIS